MDLPGFRERVLSRATRAGLIVTSPEIDRLEAYYRLLSRWNRTINLTALPLEPLSDETVDRLLIEPLAVALHVPDSPGEWFDLGSGGGSPAIPLSVVRRLLRLTMVEARERKAAFLREVVRVLGMAGSVVLNERIESLLPRADFSGVASLVTIRAIRVDPSLLHIVHHLLSPAGGRFMMLGSGGAFPDGFRLFKSVEAIELGVGSGSRLLIATV